MSKAFAEGFYKSRTWQECRESYAKSKGYLCENCLKKGLYNPGVIVHHIIELTPENINNPKVTLNHSNLRLLCRKCHAEEHARKRRYLIGINGEIILKDPPIPQNGGSKS